MVVQRNRRPNPRSKSAGVGHNSVQIPHNGRLSPDEIKDMEIVWAKAEQNMSHRERRRLIRLGRIVPAHMIKPQMMVKDANGRWCPEIRIHERA